MIVPNLLCKFTHDPDIDRKETKRLRRAIVSAIRKISSSWRTLYVVSLNYHHHSSLYIRVLLPIFDKYAIVTSFREGSSLSSSSWLSIKIDYNECCSSISYHSRHYLLRGETYVLFRNNLTLINSELMQWIGDYFPW